MIKVSVRYFAAFREAAGLETETVETVASTPAELFRERQQIHGDLGTYSAALVAINDEMSGWEDALKDGDAVLFFPPVAGG